MPLINGFDAARLIREQKQQNLLLFATTGWDQAETRRLATEAGFDQLLVKPVDLRVLTELLAGNG